MTARMDGLIKDHYSVQTFANLPMHCQLALVWFMAVDGCAWGGVDLSSVPDDADLKSTLIELLPQYVELYGDDLFGSACLSATALQEAVMRDPEISDEFSSWEEYHSWYVQEGGAPRYPSNNRWPVILSGDDFETLRDGWHRFHSYMRDGAEEVHAVFFPENHHLPARGLVKELAQRRARGQ